jgi:hypothetical protein
MNQTSIFSDGDGDFEEPMTKKRKVPQSIPLFPKTKDLEEDSHPH